MRSFSFTVTKTLQLTNSAGKISMLFDICIKQLYPYTVNSLKNF